MNKIYHFLLLISFLIFTNTVFAEKSNYPTVSATRVITTSVSDKAKSFTANTRTFPAGVENITIPKTSGIHEELLAKIASVVKQSIAEGYYPGAVVLAAHRGKIIYSGVFGNRSIEPTVVPMTLDTIFDIASLTKVIVTSTAIMQLVEQGQLNLDEPVATYWPAFAEFGKDKITIRELLTHYSGLPALLPLDPPWYGKQQAYQQVIQLKPEYNPGEQFLYSDVNFITLGYLVERISGESLDVYAEKHIFKPLRMKNTYYNPAPYLKNNIAPTNIINNQLRWAEVQDPVAYQMGGVAGMAGVFSTASDLGLFAQFILDQGKVKHYISSEYVLSPLSIRHMTSPQSPEKMQAIRGLGWDIDSKYSTNRGVLFPLGSFGHTGWTGTSLWIDPISQTWLIILTSRTHPTPAPDNQLIKDRARIANIVAASIIDLDT